MHVLITGGAGFIGSAVASQLVQAGHDVTVLDSFLTQIHGDSETAAEVWRNRHPEVRLIRGDARDRGALRPALRGIDKILHLAAETGTGQSMYAIERYADVNVMGTAALLEEVAAAGTVSGLVVASSRSIYGEGEYNCPRDGRVWPGTRPSKQLREGHFEPYCPICGGEIVLAATREDSRLSPASIYAATKLAQETMVLAHAAAHGLSAFALRYQNVYGPGQSLNNAYTGILSIFSREMLAGRPIEIFEDGQESRDFVHVDDVAKATAAALQTDLVEPVAVNIGSGVATSVLDVVAALTRIYDYKGDVNISGRFRAGDIRHNVADICLAKTILDYQPSMSFEAGVIDFGAWVRHTLEAGQGQSNYRESLIELESRGLMGSSRA